MIVVFTWSIYFFLNHVHGLSRLRMTNFVVLFPEYIMLVHVWCERGDCSYLNYWYITITSAISQDSNNLYFATKQSIQLANFMGLIVQTLNKCKYMMFLLSTIVWLELLITGEKVTTKLIMFQLHGLLKLTKQMIGSMQSFLFVHLFRIDRLGISLSMLFHYWEKIKMQSMSSCSCLIIFIVTRIPLCFLFYSSSSRSLVSSCFYYLTTTSYEDFLLLLWL